MIYETRAEAVAAGEDLYYGAPCKIHGHIIRQVNNRHCLKCQKENKKKEGKTMSWLRAECKRLNELVTKLEYENSVLRAKLIRRA